MARKRKKDLKKKERYKKFTGGFNTVALGAMNRMARESQAQIDELNKDDISVGDGIFDNNIQPDPIAKSDIVELKQADLMLVLHLALHLLLVEL
jgi:hypothetical protein